MTNLCPPRFCVAWEMTKNYSSHRALPNWIWWKRFWAPISQAHCNSQRRGKFRWIFVATQRSGQIEMFVGHKVLRGMVQATKSEMENSQQNLWHFRCRRRYTIRIHYLVYCTCNFRIHGKVLVLLLVLSRARKCARVSRFPNVPTRWIRRFSCADEEPRSW